MAQKSKKVGRPRKKRKYTQRNQNQIQGNTLGFVTEKSENLKMSDVQNEQSFNPTPSRASDASYVFIAGNRVLIQHLNDEYLNNQYEQLMTEYNEMRRQMELLENLRFNLSLEQSFRGLK